MLMSILDHMSFSYEILQCFYFLYQGKAFVWEQKVRAVGFVLQTDSVRAPVEVFPCPKTVT